MPSDENNLPTDVMKLAFQQARRNKLDRRQKELDSYKKDYLQRCKGPKPVFRELHTPSDIEAYLFEYMAYTLPFSGAQTLNSIWLSFSEPDFTIPAFYDMTIAHKDYRFIYVEGYASFIVHSFKNKDPKLKALAAWFEEEAAIKAARQSLNTEERMSSAWGKIYNVSVS